MWKLWIMWKKSRHKISYQGGMSKNVKRMEDLERRGKYYVNENIHNPDGQVMHSQIVDIVENYCPSSASPIK